MDSLNGLDHLIFSHDIGTDHITLLGASGALTLADAERWRRYVSLQPAPTLAAYTVGIFTADDHDTHLLARAQRHPDTDTPTVIYQVILLRPGDLQTLTGSLDLLASLLDTPLPPLTDTPQTLAPLPLPSMPTWTIDKRLLTLNRLLAYCEGDITRVLALLGAALRDTGLLLHNAPDDQAERLALVQGLLLLLPSAYRPHLTFATAIHDPAEARTRIAFLDSDAHTAPPPAFEAVRTPYLDALHALWQDDMKAFAGELRAMELMLARLGAVQPDLNSGLEALATRYMQARRVLAGESLPVEILKTELTSENPPDNALRQRYAELLLDHALSARDSEAAVIVTQAMDADRALDTALQRKLEALLDDQPDAVYFVVRSRLGQGIDDHWLPRLHAAAIHSLRVAVNDSDANTLTSWLKLIAREPAAYQLGDVLLQGVRAAQERAASDGALGYQLIVFVVRRMPATVDKLLQDDALLAALPETARYAVRDYDPDALLALATDGAAAGRDVFLVLLARGARAQRPEPFTPETVGLLWSLQSEEGPTTLAEPYRPQSILRGQLLTPEAVGWLPREALLTLLILLLTHREDSAFVTMLPPVIHKHPDLLSLVLFRSGRGADDVLMIVGQIAQAGLLSAQQVVDTYLQLLIYHEWGRHMLPLAEQIARVMQQNPALTLNTDMVWRLIELAEAGRVELVGRVMLRRLLAALEKLEDERQITAELLRLVEQVQWSAPLRAVTQAWWREFIRQQPVARLQTLDRAMDGKRLLDDARLVIQTSISLRRVLNRRSLEEFADAIATAYSILQALSDSFDPAPKQAVYFDQATMREELEARQAELTPEERRVLAKNLRELGGLIAEMAEHRRRATLIRREDEIERQLMAGEITPNSAIDAMKWLSGYLDGAQNRDEDAT